MKRFFHTELEDFRSNLVLMGEKAIELVRLSVRALEEKEVALCQEVLRKDDAIDELEVLIDNEGIRYISLRAPVATELRLLTVGMKVGHDLERVGDEACTIAKRTRRLLASEGGYDLLHMPRMAEHAIAMLRDAIDCFLNGDIEGAKLIPPRDREVDNLNRENYQRLTEQLVSKPEQVERLLDLIFISKSLERIADHATNLAEEVIFLYRGDNIRHSEEIKQLKKGLRS